MRFPGVPLLFLVAARDSRFGFVAKSLNRPGERFLIAMNVLSRIISQSKALRAAAAGLIAVASLAAVEGARPASAQDPISQVLGGGSAEWSDGFDAASSSANDVRTSTPILSAEIISALELAIAQYSDIVARGGWPVVPAGKTLRLGVRDPAVATLRERLAISGDLAPTTGVSEAFDSYVDAAVRRFQARHGIPVDGVIGESTLNAMNIPAGVRLTQLSTNLARLKSLTAKLPERFVMVNIPAAAVEAVESGRVISRHTAVVGKVDRPSPIVNSKIHEINFHPFWTVPESSELADR
jgi:L,D-transpeptidase YcbB